MRRAFETGGIALAGLASSAVAAIAITAASIVVGWDLFSFTIRGIVPVGAMACGAVAASGYFLAAKRLNVPPTKALGFQMLAAAATTQLLIYTLGYGLALLSGAEFESFPDYLDKELTGAHVYVTVNSDPLRDLGEAGGDGYVIALIEFAGLLVGGAWVFFALLGQPVCPQCEKYLRTLARKRDVFADDESFLAYYQGEFEHPVGSAEFARHVGTRHKGRRLGRNGYTLETRVLGCSACGTQAVDETVKIFDGQNWAEAIDLSRMVDVPASADVAAAYKGR